MNPSQKRSFWALMVTQFFGAFNDNVFKTLVTLLILRWVQDPGKAKHLVDLSGAVFVAPFLLFSMLAGRIADMFGKPRVMVVVKYWEVAVVAAAALSLWRQSLFLMMAALFMLAMHSAFFSPAKYGVLPELMGEDELSRGNGWINMLTFLAILVGTFTAARVSSDLTLACGIMAAASVVGLVASYFIEPLPAARPGGTLVFNPFKELWANWKLMGQDRAMRLAGIAVNYFWFMGAILQLSIFVYAKEMMGATDEASGNLLIAVLAGIGTGSFLAGRLSGKRVELGWVPFGALGIGVFASDLLWAHRSMMRLLIDLFMIGLSAGFYQIPLMALLQWRSPAGERGRIMATINFLSFVAILAASAILGVLHALGLNSAHIFFIIGVMSLIATAAFLTLMPDVRQRAGLLIRRLFHRS